MAFIVILLVMLGFMYLLLIRPQRSQQRRHRDLLENLKPGDEVITAGGIYGDVAAIEEEKVHLLIAEDVEIEVARKSIASVIPQQPDIVEGEAEEAVEQPELEAETADEETPTDDGLEEAGRARGAQARRQD